METTKNKKEKEGSSKKEEKKITAEQYAQHIGLRSRTVLTCKRMFKAELTTLKQWDDIFKKKNIIS
jgi:hypothetical protein